MATGYTNLLIPCRLPCLSINTSRCHHGIYWFTPFNFCVCVPWSVQPCETQDVFFMRAMLSMLVAVVVVVVFLFFLSCLFTVFLCFQLEGWKNLHFCMTIVYLSIYLSIYLNIYIYSLWRFSSFPHRFLWFSHWKKPMIWSISTSPIEVTTEGGTGREIPIKSFQEAWRLAKDPVLGGKKHIISVCIYYTYMDDIDIYIYMYIIYIYMYIYICI